MKEKVLKALWWVWMLLPVILGTPVYFWGCVAPPFVLAWCVQLVLIWGGTLLICYWQYRSWGKFSKLFSLHLAGWCLWGYLFVSLCPLVTEIYSTRYLAAFLPENVFLWICVLIHWLPFIGTLTLLHKLVLAYCDK